MRIEHVIIVVVTTLIFLGLAMLVVPIVLPYEVIKARLDVYALDGSVEFYTSEFHAKILRGIQALGAVLASLGAFVYVVRKHVEQVFQYASMTFKQNLCDLVGFFRPKPGHVPYSCLLLTLTVLGAGLRFNFLDQPIRYDEAFTFLTYASRPFYVIASYYSEPNNHVFHSLLVHISYELFGDQLWSIRLPAFLSGVLAIPASYLVARLIYGRKAGIISASLVAASSILIEYSTNARGHSLIVLFSLAILILAVYLKDRQNWVAWLLFIVVSAAGLYTVPSMLFPFGGILGWIVLSSITKDLRVPNLRQVILAGMAVVLITTLLYTPIFVVTGIDAVVANRDTVPSLWGEFWESVPDAIEAIWDSLTRDLPGIVIIIFAAGFLVGLVRHRSLSAHRVPVILAVVGWCVVVVLARRPGGIIFPRNWLFLIPLILITSGAGVALFFGGIERTIRTNSVWLLFGAVGLLFGYLGLNILKSDSIYTSTQTGTLVDAEKIVVELSQRLKPQDVVVAQVPSDFPLIYYFKRRGLPIEYFDVEKAETRLFVVVNNTWAQTLDGVLAQTPLPASIEWSRPEVVARFKGATLYELQALRGSVGRSTGSSTVVPESNHSLNIDADSWFGGTNHIQNGAAG